MVSTSLFFAFAKIRNLDLSVWSCLIFNCLSILMKGYAFLHCLHLIKSPKPLICHVVSDGVLYLDRPFEGHNWATPRPFACPTCDRRFNRRGDLMYHTTHECGKELRCPTCGRSFKQKSHLTSHVKYECGKELRCPKCDKLFKIKNNLNMHIRHDCGKEVRCLNCSKIFKTKSTLDKHMRTVCLKQ